MRTLRIRAIGPQTYGTRQLTAGEEMDLPILDAMKMVRRKEARFALKQRSVRPASMPRPPLKPQPQSPPWEPEPKQTEPEQKPAAGLTALRAEAARLGIVVDGRWGVLRLEHEIGKAKRQ